METEIKEIEELIGVLAIEVEKLARQNKAKQMLLDELNKQFQQQINE